MANLQHWLNIVEIAVVDHAIHKDHTTTMLKPMFFFVLILIKIMQTRNDDENNKDLNKNNRDCGFGISS